MENLTHIYARLIRPAAMLAAVGGYIVFAWVLMRNDLLQASSGAYIQLIACWLLGFATLAVWYRKTLAYSAYVLARVMWANLGVCALAILIPDALRLLLLVVPMLGLLFAALHGDRIHVFAIAAASWMFYVALTLGKATLVGVPIQFEVLMALAFGMMLGGSLLVAESILERRVALEERNRALRDTLERMQELALKDELTGAHNRRSILEILRRQKSLADRGQQSFTLCYADLDHFKAINDQHGHIVGDEVLRGFAHLAQGVVRDVDYVARMGGEEFVLVLVDADMEDATAIAERLCERTREMWVRGCDTDFQLTVSVGVTAYAPRERIDDVLSRADRVLYGAKQRGRDQVLTA